jgi:hypothetical protein
VITDSRKIGNTTAADKDDGMLLEVVSLTGDIGVDDLVVGELDTGDLTDGRVGLTGLLGEDTDTNTLLLEAGVEGRGFGILFEGLAAAAHDLVERGHGSGLLLEGVVEVNLAEHGCDGGGGGGG